MEAVKSNFSDDFQVLFKLPAILSHRRSTTVSLETYPFIYLS